MLLANLGSEGVDDPARRSHRPARGGARFARYIWCGERVARKRARRRRFRIDGSSLVKIYIVGRGAVGSYFGDALARVGLEVEYAPRSIDDVVPVDADVALVTTKAYDTDSAIESLRKAIRDPGKCVFVTPQNGVGNEEKLAAAFGADNVVAAALTTPVGRDRDGRVNTANEGGVALAPVGAKSYNWLIATFSEAGLTVKVVEDWRALKWSKLALNAVANASCAILNVLPNRLVHFEKIFTLEIRMIREIRAVMQAMKLTPVEPTALSRTRVVRRRVLAESGRARIVGAQHRFGARNEAAVAIAGSAQRTAADRSQLHQRCRFRRRPRTRRTHAGQRNLLSRARRHRAHAAVMGEISRASGNARGRSRRRNAPRESASPQIVFATTAWRKIFPGRPRRDRRDARRARNRGPRERFASRRSTRWLTCAGDGRY